MHLAAGGKVAGAPGLLDLGREGDAPAVVEAFSSREQATGDPARHGADGDAEAAGNVAGAELSGAKQLRCGQLVVAT